MDSLPSFKRASVSLCMANSGGFGDCVIGFDMSDFSFVYVKAFDCLLV